MAGATILTPKQTDSPRFPGESQPVFYASLALSVLFLLKQFEDLVDQPPQRLFLGSRAARAATGDLLQLVHVQLFYVQFIRVGFHCFYLLALWAS